MDAATDELMKPLGVDRPERPVRRWRLPLTPIAGGLTLTLLAGVAAWVALVDDPLGGEPHARSTIAIREAPPAEAPAGEGARGAKIQDVPSDAPRRTAAELESAAGVVVMRPDGTSAPSSVVIRIPEPAEIKLNPAPDKRLTERTRYGVLPRVGSDGAKALSVYARPAGALPGGTKPAGRIALLVGGLGVSQTATGDAIAKLPPAVTLAFAPYGGDLERHVARAREDGHEVMLQVPMEPFDYPDSDPGPHTLLAKAKPQETLDRLHWVMGRFAGYTALTNFMGAKLTADEAALAPILREIGGRGLGFVDDGSSSRSVAATVGPSVQTPTAKAEVVVDAVPRADAIDKELARLEEMARSKGFALGSASALPLTVDRIARWSRQLEGRGILLVPVSAALLGSAPR